MDRITPFTHQSEDTGCFRRASEIRVRANRIVRTFNTMNDPWSDIINAVLDFCRSHGAQEMAVYFAVEDDVGQSIHAKESLSTTSRKLRRKMRRESTDHSEQDQGLCDLADCVRRLVAEHTQEPVSRIRPHRYIERVSMPLKRHVTMTNGWRHRTVETDREDTVHTDDELYVARKGCVVVGMHLSPDRTPSRPSPLNFLLAVQTGNCAEMIRMILQGIDVNGQVGGLSFLSTAVRRFVDSYDSDALDILVGTTGIDLTIRNENGRTPFLCAAQSRLRPYHLKLIDKLHVSSYDVDRNGDSALHLLLVSETPQIYETVTKFILQGGALVVLIRNEMGQTPCDIWKNRRHRYTVSDYDRMANMLGECEIEALTSLRSALSTHLILPLVTMAMKYL
jgi:hypothetical protein